MSTINPRNLHLYIKLLSSLSTFCLLSLIGYKIYTYSPLDYSNFNYDKNDVANLIESLQIKDTSENQVLKTKELKDSIEEQRLIANQQQLLEDRRINQQNLLEDRRENKKQILEDRIYYENAAFYNTLKNAAVFVCIIGGCFFIGYLYFYGGGGGGANNVDFVKDMTQSTVEGSRISAVASLDTSENVNTATSLIIENTTQQALNAASAENSIIVSDGGGIRPATGNEIAQIPEMVRQEDII